MRVALAALLLALLAAAPAYAAFPGENGNIAFERGFNVFTIGPDGGSATQITPAGGTFTPAVAPDGRRIAFASGGDIVVIDPDAGSVTNITAALGSTDQQPAWSPDGTRIAFSRGISGQPFRIWTIGVDGSNPVQLTSTSSGDLSPAWSPGGSAIAYTRLGGSSDIYVVPATGGAETPYVSTNFTEDLPSWSPDGSQIAFVTNHQDGNGNEIYRSGQGGTGLPVTMSAADDTDPSWSPDGTRIAFTSNRSGRQQIWRVDASAVEGSPVNLSRSGTQDSQPDWGIQATLAPPRIGKTVNAQELKGSVRVRVAGSKKFVSLGEAEHLPIGSTFDTRKGTVELTFGTGGTKTQTGTFNGGMFITKQSRGNALAELRLTGGGNFGRCATKRNAGPLSSAARRPSRRLFARGRGRFRTRGRHSTATVRGTAWLTKDTCAGTLTVVKSGTVDVRDLVKNKNVRLKKGQRYLARPRRR